MEKLRSSLKEISMRFILALALAFATTSAFAEEGAAAPAKTGATVNTVCPLDGAKNNPSVPGVELKTADGKAVSVGACCAECSAKIKDSKDSAALAAAAVANKKIEEKAK
jgi:hypothetical protein